MRFILASKSPRRKSLFSKIVSSFDIVEANVTENSVQLLPDKRVMELALKKAECVYLETTGDCVVIGADTLCFMDGENLGKPLNEKDAKRMLLDMRGRTHDVYTGVAIIYNGKKHVFFDRSTVKFKQLTEKEIDDYIATGKPMDKAGAYGIQDGFVVESFAGSYDNIVGLPVEKLKQELKTLELI